MNKYDTFFDQWTTFHVIGGAILLLLFYLLFTNIVISFLFAMMMNFAWEILENIYIKPSFFPDSPVENNYNIIGDIFWTSIGMLLVFASYHIFI